MHKLAAVLAILLLLQSASAQTAVELHEQIRNALSAREYAATLDLLEGLEKDDPESFRANNYDYLLARLYERMGDSAAAAAHYEDVVRRNSVLKDYATWHLSQIARASGNLLVERIYLEELRSFGAGDVFDYPVGHRIAESWYDSQNFDIAIDALERGSDKPQPTASRDRDRLSFLAEAYVGAGNASKAREIFDDLIASLTDPSKPDDAALAAVHGLDLLDGEGELSPEEHFRRAGVYQFNREFDAARRHYLAIMSRYPGNQLIPESAFQTGRGFGQSGDHVQALEWFERVLEQYPEDPIAEETLLYAASSYARIGKRREAIQRYRKYVDQYPQGKRVDRAYLNTIDTLRDEREETEALQWIETIRNRFPNMQPAALATFAEVRIHLARGNWENALAALELLEKFPDLGMADTPGGTSLAEVKFLRAFALEQLRRYPEAIELYLSIPDGVNEYFGWRATERLRQLASDVKSKEFIEEKLAALRSARAGDPESTRRSLQSQLRLVEFDADRKRLLAELRTVYAALPAYAPPKFKLVKLGRQAPIGKKRNTPSRVSDELLFLGLSDEAAPEVDAGRSSKPAAKSDFDFTLANLYMLGDNAGKGVAYVESAWKTPADHQIELLPNDVSRMLYPAPYADIIVKYASERSLDPRFLLALMRQESGFRTDIRSTAAARGLMQFTPSTANRIAGEIGDESFRQSDLYDPHVAIRFASEYAGNLFQLFPNQTEAVVGSYNGGEDNMKRWMGRAKSDQPERYVPEIMFSQTKEYVLRVMANYRVYKLLYDEKLRPH